MKKDDNYKFLNNPFESGHIKNYILLYASVVVIMVLFFVASSLFYEVKEVDKKVFDTVHVKPISEVKKQDVQSEKTNPFSEIKLMPKGY